MTLFAEVCFSNEALAVITGVVTGLVTAVVSLFWVLRDSYSKHLTSIQEDRNWWREEAIKCGCREHPWHGEDSPSGQ